MTFIIDGSASLSYCLSITYYQHTMYTHSIHPLSSFSLMLTICSTIWRCPDVIIHTNINIQPTKQTNKQTTYALPPTRFAKEKKKKIVQVPCPVSTVLTFQFHPFSSSTTNSASPLTRPILQLNEFHARLPLPP